MNRAPERHLFVVLGATGDLGTRKVLPALYHLASRGALETVVLGAGTHDLGDEEFRRRSREALAAAGMDGEAAAAWCARNLHYAPIPADGDFTAFAARVAALEAEHALPGNRVFYLALPPAAFPAAIAGLGAAGLARGPGWARLVVEKPFGHDLATADDLNHLVHRHFAEEQVYRIDHYLGKETVQNLLVFRFANPLFEASWNRDRIARVEITVAEVSGVGSRGRYYDAAGAVRDMLQSHLTQLLTLVAMEAPVSMAADAVRAEKVKVLRSIRPLDPQAVVLGQYGAGTAGGADLPAYRDLDGVTPGSTHPYLRRHHPFRGQLALAGSPVPPAHRQGDAGAPHPGGGDFPTPAGVLVPRALRPLRGALQRAVSRPRSPTRASAWRSRSKSRAPPRACAPCPCASPTPRPSARCPRPTRPCSSTWWKGTRPSSCGPTRSRSRGASTSRCWRPICPSTPTRPGRGAPRPPATCWAMPPTGRREAEAPRCGVRPATRLDSPRHADPSPQ